MFINAAARRSMGCTNMTFGLDRIAVGLDLGLSGWISVLSGWISILTCCGRSQLVKLLADRAALNAFVRRRLAHAGLWTLGCGAVAATILVIEYRLMLFAIVALAVPTVLLVVAFRTKRSLAGLAFCQLEVGDGVIDLSTSAERVAIPFGQLINTRVAEDHIIVAYRAPHDGQIRGWAVPGDDQMIRQIAAHLQAAGVDVIVERQLGRRLAAIFGGVILWRVLGVVAAGLVLGAVVNIVTAIIGNGGTLPLGLGLLGGAAVCATVVILIRMKLTGS